MKLISPDGGVDGEHIDGGVVGISKLSRMHDSIIVEQNHLTDFRLAIEKIA